jgi:hypothetical protein
LAGASLDLLIVATNPAVLALQSPKRMPPIEATAQDATTLVICRTLE